MLKETLTIPFLLVTALDVVQAQALDFAVCQTFELVWNDRGSGASADGAFWRPKTQSGYVSVGDLAVLGYGDPNGRRTVLVVKDLTGNATSRPRDFDLIWSSRGSTTKRGSIWAPVPQPGYVAMGCVAHDRFDKPSFDSVRCVRSDLVESTPVGALIWSNQSPTAPRYKVAVFETQNGRESRAAGSFVAFQGYTKGPSHPCAHAFKPVGGSALNGDVYDYKNARAVVRIDQRVPQERKHFYVFTKKLKTDRFGVKITFFARVILGKKGNPNYYTLAMITPGVMGGDGMGYSGSLLPWCSDWNVHKEAQAIYASGYSLEAAAANLQARFNGTTGNTLITAAGDVQRGEVVITILGPVYSDENNESVRRKHSVR